MPMRERRRLRIGAVVTPRTLVTITGDRLRIPDPRGLVHLQFRRFAGCPVCNLHLRTVVQRHAEILAAGVQEIALFHSSEEQLRQYEPDLPIPVVADPSKTLYREFGVEASPRALLHPRALLPIARAVADSARRIVRDRRPVPPLLRPEGGRFGLPADFLIDNDGVVRACHYGIHVDDQWSVDEILDLAKQVRAQPRSVRIASAR